MDKDRGYAWVILGASSVLMCIGPSTFTSYGFLMRGVVMEEDQFVWIINLFYISWVISACLASWLAKDRPRQLATTGSAIASIGFISSASTVAAPHWHFATYSMSIGFGLGLAFHTAYLVVMSNFEKYKGLANGVCQMCIAIGQITTPFIFTAVHLSRDRFQIKSLTTAVGFLTTLFFVVPSAAPHRTNSVVDRNRRPSTVRTSKGETLPLNVGSTLGSSSIRTGAKTQPQQARTRRRSQYLLAVSTSLLPNIPEEPESTHSTNDTLTSASSDSELQVEKSSSSIATTAKDDFAKLTQDVSHTKTESTTGEQVKMRPDSLSSQHIPLRRLSDGCLPEYIGNGDLTEVSVEKKAASPSPNPSVTPLSRRQRSFSESQAQQGNVHFVPLLRRDQSLQSSKASMQNERRGNNVKKGESTIDFSLLRDFHFINLAAFSAFCTMAVVNYPLLLYMHIIAVCPDCESEANAVLMIIILMDLISRLTMSYFSDYSILSIRTGFLVACVCSGVTIVVTPFVTSMTVIYSFSVLYGFCQGVLLTYEYLLLREAVGSQRFSGAYGMLHAFKLAAVAVLGILAMNPLSTYMYSIHPLDIRSKTSGNNTLTFDPLNIYPPYTEESTISIRLFISIAVPSILCALAWITEDVYKATQKCTTSTGTTGSKSQASSQPNNDVP